MKSLITDSVMAKLMAVSVAGAVVAPQLNDISRPFIGTSLTVLVAAFGGAVGAFAYFGEPNRVKLFGMAMVNAFLAAALATILPLWLGWEWMTPEVKKVAEPPLAFVIAFLLRWGVPLMTEVGPTWVRNRFGKSTTPAPGA